jgi:hypothetical protein
MQNNNNSMKYLKKFMQLKKKQMKQTAVDFLIKELLSAEPNILEWHKLLQQAKAMEKEQIGYTKEDVLTAGEMGEINTYDTKHIVSYLDEAKQFNETYGGE